MKKILFLMTLLAIGISQAQNTKRDRSPEQVASIQSKKMTLALDLDATQQARVEQLLLVNAKERQTHKMNKKDRVQLNDLEKLTRMETMLDKRIAVKREMKSILNADQYKSWEKMMAKSAKRIGEKNRRGERRNPR
ncbi:MAG: protein CpxP [Nonlabens sp.]|jgi:protein CpxP